MTVILINNKFVSEKKATISVLSDSFQRGYGVFETLRTYGNKKLFLEKEHIERLFKSARNLDLKIKYSQAEIESMLKKVVEKSTNEIQRLKIIAIKEGLIINSTAFKDEKKLLNGVSLMSIECQRSLPEIKSISYLPSVLAHEKATEKGSYDALLIDEEENVYEGGYCNIFWFENDVLCTTKDKILEGITRNAIIKWSPFKVKLKSIKLKSLIERSEIFLTQSTRGILPVIKIDKTKIGDLIIGEKTKHLIKILNERTSTL